MKYHAVGNRCAVDFNDFQLPISVEKSLEILTQKNFRQIDVDLLSIAKSFVGASSYCRGARSSDAPRVFDCSSIIKYLYGQKGIWLPRRSIQQIMFGDDVNLTDIHSGDVVFVSGYINYYRTNPEEGVGHVGIATGNGTIIHAANRQAGIIESPLEKFIEGGKLRGIRRFIPEGHQIYTFLTPKVREVEWSDDIYWIILQSL